MVYVHVGLYTRVQLYPKVRFISGSSVQNDLVLSLVGVYRMTSRLPSYLLVIPTTFWLSTSILRSNTDSRIDDVCGENIYILAKLVPVH